jgi:C1A family cysteine protease
MKLVFSAGVLAATALASSPETGFRHPQGQISEIETAWLKYKLQHQKHYQSSTEENARFSNFQKSVAKIQKHKSKPSKMSVTLNKFSDWSEQEFLDYQRLGKTIDYPEEETEFECPEKFEDYLKFHQNPEIEAEFKNGVDWRDASKNPLGLVADVGVKDQAKCGSCYAFSAVAAMEGSLCTQGRYDCAEWEGLSEQNVMDCGSYVGDVEMPWYGFGGCFGGWQSNVFEYVYFNDGMSCGGNYPYESGNATAFDTPLNIGECRYDASMNHGFPDKSICGTVNKFGWQDKTTEELMKKAIYFKGPLAVGMFVGDIFSSYAPSGNPDIPSIYMAENAALDCPDYEEIGINHALTAVGYGVYDDFSEAGHVTIPYWIIKNSWSNTWGDAGYVLVEAGKNVCGIEGNVMYVNMTPVEGDDE